MDVFDIYAKISLDTSEYDKGLDNAGDKANIFAGDFLTYGTQTYILMGVGLIFCTGLPFKAFRKYREKPWMSIIMLAIFWYAIYNLYQSAGDPFMYFNF